MNLLNIIHLKAVKMEYSVRLKTLDEQKYDKGQ